MKMSLSRVRRNCIPIVHTRGTHYEVGCDIGRTFRGMIENYVENNVPLNEEYLPRCTTPEGRKLYDDTLKCVKTNFPQYVAELEGLAHGSGVPFEKLFKLNMGQLIPGTSQSPRNADNEQNLGCSSICCNESFTEILGHTEDAPADILGQFYLVSVHITEEKPQGKWRTKEEKFVSLCYPGYLPGYTMNYNHHGLVYSINTIRARNLCAGKTPESILCRALLAAENLGQVEDVLRDSGCGSAVGFGVNLTFLDEPGDRTFYNYEIGPASPCTNESLISKLEVGKGEQSFHCNKYLRLNLATEEGSERSSNSRHRRFEEVGSPRTKNKVLHLLSDQTQNEDFPIFRNGCSKLDYDVTIAVGIFDCIERTWSIYADKPDENDPMLVMPLLTLKRGM